MGLRTPHGKLMIAFCSAFWTSAASFVGDTIPQRNNHNNISKLLDNLLRGYDNSVRPDFGGPPAAVEVDIMVRSMGPISEIDMTYSMDCYFRQSWVDRRLAFVDDDKDTLALSISMLARIWKPDTYFYNGKQSYLHTITTPNKFVRLYQDGRVLYSSRLTIKAGCLMNLEDFPMDIQRCPLRFGSFGYTTRDVIYRWNQARQVVTAEDMKLSQFDLIGTPTGNYTDAIIGLNPRSDSDADGINITEYSMLLVSFHLQRHMGNFLIQVYGPCVLLVVLSWVSFWLNREATADRVSLGITTVLTMTFLGLEARTDLPKVPYPTALDYFVFLSFTFIFATIIQFALVHYFTKYGSGECYFSAELVWDSSSEGEDCSPDKEISTVASIAVNDFQIPHTSSQNRGAPRSQNNLIEVIPLTPCTLPKSKNQSRWKCFGVKDVKGIKKPCEDVLVCEEMEVQQQCRKKKRKRLPRFNSVSKIDRAARIVFPVLFLAINIFYWYSYLARTKRVQ